MSNPFKNEFSDNDADQADIQQALRGSKTALERLVKRHQHYVYNLAHKLVMNPMDAEDVTQEVMVKMVTKLAQFEGRSEFRTWLYRITFNHFLSMRKRPLEHQITTFSAYGQALDQVEDVEMTADQELEYAETIEEAKLGCMSGMLMCLNREQRAVFVLGEIFQADHSVGAEILEISKANYRKRLERARKDLFNFMHAKCGLINKNNPCRCSRKTTGFIKLGYVDPENRRFNSSFKRNIEAEIEGRTHQLKDLLEGRYSDLYLQAPFQEKEHAEKLMQAVLVDEDVRRVFNLN